MNKCKKAKRIRYSSVDSTSVTDVVITDSLVLVVVSGTKELDSQIFPLPEKVFTV